MTSTADTADTAGTAGTAGTANPAVLDDVVALERVAARGWAADEIQDHASGWLLRAAEGFTGRANSALVVTHPGDDLDEVLADVAAWYADRGLPARVSVPLPVFGDVEAALLDRGWQRQWGAHVMTRTLDGIVPPPGAPHVEVATSLSSAWIDRYHYRGGALPEAAPRVLERGEHVGFASVRDGDEVVAIGRGAVTDGWLGITAIETSPTHRRRGLASAVLAGLAAWARETGATRAYLQVDLENDVARQMYARAGFTQHHRYHYLGLPDPGGAPSPPESC